MGIFGLWCVLDEVTKREDLQVRDTLAGDRNRDRSSLSVIEVVGKNGPGILYTNELLTAAKLRERECIYGMVRTGIRF